MRWLVLVACLWACSDSTGPKCTERTETIEVEWGSLMEDVQEQLVEVFRAEGWTCRSQPLRNAFGTQIGLVYTCTICD